MKQQKLIICIVSIFWSIIGISSQEISDAQRKSLNPITPTAYQFIKFGEIPVNEYSGSPTIEIPLYDIGIRGFSLPIKLQYHSKGIRVSEESDWVGLGWDLSFGSITQMVNDKDDLDRRFSQSTIPYINNPFPSTWEYSQSAPIFTNMSINNSNTDYSADKTYSFTTFTHNLNGSENWDVESTVKFNSGDRLSTDYEKDIFIANVLGEQLYILIKPVFNANGTLSANTTYTVLNKKGYKVSIEQPDQSKKIWKIINPSGITCYFEEINSNNNSTFTITDTFDRIFTDQNTLLQSNASNYSGTFSGITTSCIWQITKIINIYGDAIQFNYSNKKLLGSTNCSFQWKVGTGYKNQIGTYNSSDGYDNDGGPYNGAHPSYMHEGAIHDVIFSSTINTQERSYLVSISYNQNTILFNTSSRDDWTNAQKLDSIVVINSKQQNIKSIKFNYDYYQSSYTGRGINKYSDYNTQIKRLRLTTLVTQKKENYSFTYNCTTLPPKNSFAVDFWGYYNGQINNKSPLPNYLDFNPKTGDNTLDNLFNNNSGKLYAVAEYCKAGILEKIQYPTGGYSKFSYSLNCFDNYKIPNDPLGATDHYYGNGLKIDSVTNYTSNGTVATIKYYQYEKGKIQTPLHYFYNKSESYCEISNIPANYDSYRIFRYGASIINTCSNNYFMANPTGDGTGVGYDKVSSWVINRNTKAADNGKIVHYYCNTPEIISNLIYGELIESVPTYHKGLSNGTLLREEVYNYPSVLKSATQFSYNLSYDTPILYNNRATYLGVWIVGNNRIEKLHVAYYPLYKPETLLISKRKADFVSSDSIVTTEDYRYSEFNILSNKYISASNSSQQLSENYYFPADILKNLNYSKPTRDIMDSLVSHQRISEIVKTEKAVYTYGVGSKKTQYTEYDSNTLLPSMVKTSLGNNPLITELTFIYDSKKNIVQTIGKDNIPNSYIWGYNYQYPVAEIKNASYTDVAGAVQTVFSTNIDDLSAMTVPDEGKLKDGSLQNALPNALVTTYTYKPLVGISSITDPRGVTTRYYYDDFNRLQSIVNTNNQTTQSFDYNYKH